MDTDLPFHSARPLALAAAGLMAVAATGCGSGNPAPPSASPAAVAGGGADSAGGGAADRAAADAPAREGADQGGALSATANTQVVDRIAAVVGDTAILMSEVQQELFRMRSQGTISQIPQSQARRDSLIRSVLDRMIDDMILLQAAQRSGATVPDARLEQAVDQQFQQIQSQFPSQAAFRKAVEQTGMNMYQYRQSLRTDVRSGLIRRTYLQNQRATLPPVAVTEEEVRQAYRQRWASRQRPARITVRRVLIHPEPDSAAADSARALAEKALAEIRSGTAFEVAVRRYTDDQATREQGGELGWLQRSDVTDAFARAAWNAPPGRPAGPVRTPLGFHVIEIQNVRGGERNIRHILVRPEVTEEDIAEARKLAASVADSIRQGADPARLAKVYGERGDLEKASEQQIPVNQLQSRLGQAYAQAIGSSPEEGAVTGPFEVSSPGPYPSFAVVQVTNHRPAGQPELSEVREQVRQQVRQQKQFQQLLERLRGEFHVEVRL